MQHVVTITATLMVLKIVVMNEEQHHLRQPHDHQSLHHVLNPDSREDPKSESPKFWTLYLVATFWIMNPLHVGPFI